MNPLKYENLTRSQILFISNGCGAKGLPIDVPDFVYEKACDRHDVNYWIGGTEEDRKQSDIIFYYDMIDSAKSKPWVVRWFYYGLSLIYYRAVRWFASNWFHYGKKRTMFDLKKAMSSV